MGTFNMESNNQSGLPESVQQQIEARAKEIALKEIQPNGDTISHDLIMYIDQTTDEVADLLQEGARIALQSQSGAGEKQQPVSESREGLVGNELPAAFVNQINSIEAGDKMNNAAMLHGAKLYVTYISSIAQSIPAPVAPVQLSEEDLAQLFETAICNARYEHRNDTPASQDEFAAHACAAIVQSLQFPQQEREANSGGWQPIETVPMDGTRVLRYNKRAREIMIVAFDKSRNTTTIAGYHWQAPHSPYREDDFSPSWMPLPSLNADQK